MKKLVDIFNEHGFNLHDFNCDGNIHRFDRAGKKSGFYAISEVNGHYYAVFGDWKTGEQYVKSTSSSVQSDKSFKTLMQKVEKDKIDEQEKTAISSRFIFENANDNINTTDYLKNKKVDGLYGCKTSFELQGRTLLVPCRDIRGKLWGIQTIYPDGSKLFSAGQRIKGTFHLFGEVKEDSLMYVCEGFATAASIHIATNQPVFCAFNANNLLSVCEAVSEKYSNYIIIAGDDDQFTTLPDGTKKNTGREKAKLAASHINAKAIFPQFKNTDTRPTDFNDLFCLEGPEVVREQLELPLPEMPASLLPESIKYYCLDVQKQLNIPLEYIAYPLISSISSIVGAKTWGRPLVDGGYYTPTFIWCLGVGDKGSKKSPSFDQATIFLRDIQKKLNAEYDDKMASNANKIQFVEDQIKAIKRTFSKLNDQEFEDAEKQLSDLNQQLKEIKPVRRTILFNDITTAAMIDLIAQNKNVIGAFDELGYLFSMIKQEHSQQLRNLFLLGWNANQSIDKRTRKDDEPIIVDDFSISIQGMIQPSTMQSYFSESQKDVVDDGFLDRILQLCYMPEPLKPTKMVNFELNKENVSSMRKLFEDLFYKTPQNFGAKQNASKNIYYLDFTEEASELYKDYALEIEQKAFLERDTYIKGWLSKAKRTLSSLSTIFFLLEKANFHIKSDKIEKNHVELAYQWVKHTENHAKAIINLV